MLLLPWESFIEFSRHVSVTSPFNSVSSWAFKVFQVHPTNHEHNPNFQHCFHESKKLYWSAFICSLLPHSNVATVSNTQMETSVNTLAINLTYNFTLLQNTWIFAILFCMFWPSSEFLYSSPLISKYVGEPKMLVSTLPQDSSFASMRLQFLRLRGCNLIKLRDMPSTHSWANPSGHTV